MVEGGHHLRKAPNPHPPQFSPMDMLGLSGFKRQPDQFNRVLNVYFTNKANLRDLIVATGLVILLRFDSNRRFFSPRDFEFWQMTLKSSVTPLLYYVKLCASFQSHRWIQTWVTVRKRSMRVKIGDFFVPCDLECGWMTLKNNRGPLLHYTKLCASFQSHQRIQTWVTVQKTPNSGQNRRFFVPCDLESWWMTLKNNRAPLLTYTSSFVHHFVAIGEFKLELQSGNDQFGSKSAIFCPVWPWNLMDDLEIQ